MRALLETELPHVERVTHLAATLRAAVEPHLGRTRAQYATTTLLPHQRSALVAVASRAVLHDYVPAEVIAYAVLKHDGSWVFSDAGDDPQYAELGAALRRPEVLALLAETATASASAPVWVARSPRNLRPARSGRCSTHSWTSCRAGQCTRRAVPASCPAGDRFRQTATATPIAG